MKEILDFLHVFLCMDVGATYAGVASSKKERIKPGVDAQISMDSENLHTP